MGKIQRLFRKTLGLIMSEIVTDEAQMQRRCKRRGIILLLGVFIFVCINIKSQNQIESKTRIEHLDKKQIHDFKKFIEKSNESSQIDTLENGDIQYLAECTDNTYEKRIESGYSPYCQIFIFDLEGNLRNRLTTFSKFVIGKEYFYNKLGQQVQEVDHDSIYKFTLSDLQRFIKKTYSIDIMNKKEILEIYRSDGWKLNRYNYDMSFRDKYDSSRVHYLLIDGITGELMYETTHPFSYDRTYSTAEEYYKLIRNISSSGLDGGDTSEKSSNKK